MRSFAADRQVPTSFYGFASSSPPPTVSIRFQPRMNTNGHEWTFKDLFLKHYHPCRSMGILALYSLRPACPFVFISVHSWFGCAGTALTHPLGETFANPGC